MAWESCGNEVVQFFLNEKKAATIPMFEEQIWKGYRVLEDSPAGNVEVLVEKIDGSIKATLIMNKTCLIPYYWFDEPWDW